jgi:hypothetical protein
MLTYDARLNILGGFAVGMLITLLLRDAASIERGDVMTFLGAVIGVAGAIYGAVEVENIKRRRQLGEDRKIIHHALDNLEKAWDPQNHIMDVAIGDVAEIMLRCATYLDAVRDVEFAIRTAVIRDPQTWSILTRIQRGLEQLRPELESRGDLTKFDPAFDYAAFERQIYNQNQLMKLMVKVARRLLPK